MSEGPSGIQHQNAELEKPQSLELLSLVGVMGEVIEQQDESLWKEIQLEENCVPGLACGYSTLGESTLSLLCVFVIAHLDFPVLLSS